MEKGKGEFSLLPARPSLGPIQLDTLCSKDSSLNANFTSMFVGISSHSKIKKDLNIIKSNFSCYDLKNKTSWIKKERWRTLHSL
jgi:hypothetical protein